MVSDTQFLLSLDEQFDSAVDYPEFFNSLFEFVSSHLALTGMSIVAFDDPQDTWRSIVQRHGQGNACRADSGSGQITDELRSLSSRFSRSALVIEDYESAPDAACVQQLGETDMRSGVHAFVHNEKRLVGGFVVQHEKRCRYSERDGLLVQALAHTVSPILRKWDGNVGAAKQETLKEPRSLPAESSVWHDDGTTRIVGSSACVRRLYKEISHVAPTDATALILGETGTGKELVASRIFELSTRREKPYVVINCAALSPELVASELFGHVAGAFTGAKTSHKGRFEMADGGTLFLDEVGDLPAETQVKLLRTVESGEFQRVGGTKTLITDVRIIAATHRNLEEMAAQGRFRADLFYRLNVFPIRLSPLRERVADVLELAQHFVCLTAKQVGKLAPPIDEAAAEMLKSYAWPGNVRELRNVMERALILSKCGPIHSKHLPPAIVVGDDADVWKETQFLRGQTHADPLAVGSEMPAAVGAEVSETIESLDSAIRGHILRALKATDGRVSGKGGAASLLGINPKTLESKMRKLGIQRRWS